MQQTFFLHCTTMFYLEVVQKFVVKPIHHFWCNCLYNRQAAPHLVDGGYGGNFLFFQKQTCMGLVLSILGGTPT